MTEQVQIKWLDSCYRGTTPEENGLDARIIKALFRKGDRVRGEGSLANYVDADMDDEKFKASINRLIQYKFIEVSSAFHGSARRFKLLAYDVAAQLIGKDQIAESDAAAKEYRERFQ